jgi:hypothetical protein
MKGPDHVSPLVAALVAVGVLFAFGYSIYSKILNQMAKNAKNKRIKERSYPMDRPRIPAKQAEMNLLWMNQNAVKSTPLHARGKLQCHLMKSGDDTRIIFFKTVVTRLARKRMRSLRESVPTIKDAA